MKNKSIKKMIAAFITLLLFIIILAPALNSASVKITGNQFELSKNLKSPSEDGNWIWKEPYPNYSPNGVPDFDQKQSQWKSIIDGGNGIVETNATGDDIQLIQVGNGVDPGEIIIAPGENCQLDTTTSGDDVEKWAFSGPTALANCFWWFDSKFANPNGIPGDGKDDYPLVKKYGFDDHSPDNVPLLIEELARAINTSGKGKTTMEDIDNAIDLWLTNTSLDDRLKKTIKNEPTFEFIAEEINRSQNVILLIGFYDYEIGQKRTDQSQTKRTFSKYLQSSTWWDYQSFIPTVERLDSIKIPLHSVTSETCELEINVYDTENGDPIGTSSLDPGILQDPAWIQFHFKPYIELTPFQAYFFDVHQVESGYHYEWYYSSPDPYDQGVGWMNKIPEDMQGLPFDWTFETEYYNPPPGSIRNDALYVTCAGVNLGSTMIAFSDPLMDVNNTNDIDHNDAQNISHDTYIVEQTCPCPDLNYSIWLPSYPTFFNYTLVEQAIIICPIPDDESPEVTITKPRPAIYFNNQEVYYPLSWPLPIIFGSIDIEVNASDNREIEYVEFKITLLYGEIELKWTDYNKPYRYKWEDGAFFFRQIWIVAVDSSGNYGYADPLLVMKFF